MSAKSFLEVALEQLKTVAHADLPAVAAESGVPLSTLLKVRYGSVKNPRVRTIQALHDFFARRAATGGEG